MWALINQRFVFSNIQVRKIAHYAEDCWDCELHGGAGDEVLVDIVIKLIAFRIAGRLVVFRCCALGGMQTPLKRSPRISLSPVSSVIGPAPRRAALVMWWEALSQLVELLMLLHSSCNYPDGTTAKITPEMVTRRTNEVTVHGEWFTPCHRACFWNR